MKMRRFFSLLLAMMMVLSFTACRPSGILDEEQSVSEPTGTEPTDPKDTVKEAEVTVWTPIEDQNETNNWLVKMQEAFQNAHPEYVITWKNALRTAGDAKNEVVKNPNGSADVYIYLNESLQELVEYGGLTALTGSHIQQVKDDNTPLMVESVTHTDGNLYGFPIEGNIAIMYYNKDVYTEEDVKSLDTMVEKGRVLLPMRLAWTAGMFFLGTGCTIFGENGKDASAGIDFGGEKGYLAAQKMVELNTNPNVTVGAFEADKLAKGEVDAMFSGSWNTSYLKEKMGDKVGVAVPPKFTANGQEYPMKVLGNVFCVGVNANTCQTAEKKEICLEFAAFLASEEAQLERYQISGATPIAKDLINHPAIVDDPVAYVKMNTIQNVTVLQPALPGMDNYWDPMDAFGYNLSKGDIHLYNYKTWVDTLYRQLNP